MPWAADVAALLSAIVWLYLFCFRGFFWRLGEEAAGSAPVEDIVAVIPARNEAGFIGASVGSLAAQGIPVIVVDDESTDGTADTARSAHSAVIVRKAGPRPPGWTGKMWAVHNGLDAASSLSPRYVLLTDADIEHAPGSVSALASLARKHDCDLVSWMAHLHCEAPHEKALIPAFVFFFFKLYPPAWIRNRRNRTAGAAGGCMLVRYDALTRIGGVESIRGELIDDCALADRIKHGGGAIRLGITRRVRSLRPYSSPDEVWRMIKRTAFTQLRHSTLLLAGTAAAMILTYIVPVALAGSGHPLAIAACVLMMAAYLPSVRWYGMSWIWMFSLPLSALFYLGATIASALDYWNGRGGEWKGRVQDAR